VREDGTETAAQATSLAVLTRTQRATALFYRS
jgi:hypothetical protein